MSGNTHSRTFPNPDPVGAEAARRACLEMPADRAACHAVQRMAPEREIAFLLLDCSLQARSLDTGLLADRHQAIGRPSPGDQVGGCRLGKLDRR